MSPEILLVDDDFVTASVLGELLVMEGLPVDICDGGAKALEHLNARPYAILLTDHVMPGMSGLQLTHIARELHPAIRCIVITGQARPMDTDLGPVLWFRKPLDFDKLLHALRA